MPSVARDHYLSNQERTDLARLRQLDPARTAAVDKIATLADRVADRLAAEVGSWRFVIIQSVVFATWMLLNVVGWFSAWDPYPFILLNLVLSFQAAYTAPIIMMSQNRQAELDRHRAMSDYEINLQAALEIRSLHGKLDAIRENEIPDLKQMLSQIEGSLAAMRTAS